MNRFLLLTTTVAAALALAGCNDYVSSESSDTAQRKQQEAILKEGTSAVGMPNIVNFQQRRQLKDITEMLDQTGIVTYTYTFSEMTGKTVFFCNSIGYAMPYATQFTNPEKIAQSNTYGVATLPQADPDGNFKPNSAEGTWVMCVDPQTKVARPVYVEPRIITSQFPLTADTPAGTQAKVATVLPTSTRPQPAPTPPAATPAEAPN